MRDMKTNISAKILHFFHRSWLIQTLRGVLRGDDDDDDDDDDDELFLWYG